MLQFQDRLEESREEDARERQRNKEGNKGNNSSSGSTSLAQTYGEYRVSDKRVIVVNVFGVLYRCAS